MVKLIIEQIRRRHYKFKRYFIYKPLSGTNPIKTGKFVVAILELKIVTERGGRGAAKMTKSD